jgi:alanine-alpha-ketoisovalerate/valine-pyruvate aminotransferase
MSICFFFVGRNNEGVIFIWIWIKDLPTIALKNVITYQDKKMLVRVVQHRLNSYQNNIM